MSTATIERVGLEEIVEKTARFFGVAELDIHSPTRMRRPTTARHTAMYLTRELTDHTLREIGEAIGGRDHTTVMHALESIEARIDTEPDFAEEIERLRAQLNGEKKYAIGIIVEEYSTVYVTARSEEEALELYRDGAHSEPTNRWWDNERITDINEAPA